MLQQLSFADFLALSKQAKQVIVFREFMADELTLVGMVQTLHQEMHDGVVLESDPLAQEGRGRYSFIAFDAMAGLEVKAGLLTQHIGKETLPASELSPFDAMRQLIKTLNCRSHLDQTGFMGSIVGYLSYDAVRLFEKIPDQHLNDIDLPEMAFHFYRTTLVFDHREQKLVITTAVPVDDQPENAYEKALTYLGHLADKVKQSHASTQAGCEKELPPLAIQADIGDQDFMEKVKKAKHHIEQGDAFQIVLSRRFTCPYHVNPFDIYRALRFTSPAPYMFYLPLKDRTIVGASPERFISVDQRRVTISPIAGTRPRHQSKAAIEAELLSDVKECAEHMMLVDLGRNDLGAICEPGSIEIEQLLQVKHFSHVSHITSTLSGRLCSDYDAFDALAKVFPAGTLSGAPKIRAMEIIDELETSRRGLYGGAICRLDYEGNLDSCIAIRMAVLKDGLATIRAGAGVVYDSDPKKEMEETRHKANTVLSAIALAEGQS